MSRGLSSSQAALQSLPHRISVPLVEAFFTSGTLRLALCEWDITVGGNTYTRGPLIDLKRVRESSTSKEGLELSLSGLSTEIIALATQEPYQGRVIRLLKANLHPDTHAVVGTPLAWFIGRMRALPVSETNDQAAVALQAEHYDVDFDRVIVNRLSDSSQQSMWPGPPADLGCQYCEQMVERKIIWPTKEALGQSYNARHP